MYSYVNLDVYVTRTQLKFIGPLLQYIAPFPIKFYITSLQLLFCKLRYTQI